MCQFWKTFSHSFCHEIIPHSTHMITPGEKALKRAKNAILDRHERKLEHGAAILRAWNHNYFAPTTTPTGAPKHYFATTTTTTGAPKVLATGQIGDVALPIIEQRDLGGESPFSCFVRNILFRLVCYKRLALLYKLDTLQLFALLHDHMSEKRSNCANLDQAKADDSIFVFALAFFGIANMSC